MASNNAAGTILALGIVGGALYLFRGQLKTLLNGGVPSIASFATPGAPAGVSVPSWGGNSPTTPGSVVFAVGAPTPGSAANQNPGGGQPSPGQSLSLLDALNLPIL